MTTTIEHINGVDTQALAQSIQAVESEPQRGLCRFRATNRWVSGAHNRATMKEFYANLAEDASRSEPFFTVMDEPPFLVGQNRGANPVEVALAALSGCLTTTLVYYAALMGVELRSVESSLEGDLDLRGLFNIDPNMRRGYRNIRVTFRIDSDAPRHKLEELVRVARSFSPVCDTIANPVNVAVELAA
jgi:uncharacterized OsmC-like protein